MNRKIVFYVMTFVSIVLLIEVLSFVAFSLVAKRSFSYSRINSERSRLSDEAGLISAYQPYQFLDNLEDAEIITEKENQVRKAIFRINRRARTVLFAHPNSEVIFRDVPIDENAKLKFGIGINPPAWDKAGDGVLFEINIVDEKSEDTFLFSRYIDPKNRVEDRKWFDEQVDLRAFAGRKVSFVFKTTAGPKSSRVADWAGWSSPRIESPGSKKIITSFTQQAMHPYVGYVLDPDYYNQYFGQF